ncbi:sensor domain-containing phosphodiesterase [Rhizobium sp. 814_E9_N1_1]|uniref:sensor domain-containing phosphodiesterase n=1 Tax=unclassified Rhizobium TaxID=2613769 RepID=UPI003F268D09
MKSKTKNSPSEARRLARLRSYGVLDEKEDPILSQYAKMAAQIAGTPLSMVSLVDADWQFAKGSFGPVAPRLARQETVCAHVVDNANEGLIINDLSKDERFARRKFVTEGPQLRFYAGIPLDGDDEGSIGSFCVMDTIPRELTVVQIEQLKLLGKAVMSHIEMMRMAKHLEELTGEPAAANLRNSEERSAKVGDIKRALARDEFINYYQPKVDLKTGNIIGAEALVRWIHPERGLIQPSEFIPLMEETGLIVEAGRGVLERAMEDWSTWSGYGLSPPQIAVNVSAKQFLDDELIDDVAAALVSSGNKDARPLSIELTESGLITNRDKISQQLSTIRELGVPVALDDFGTGYSSLSYLATLPVDVLKIDRTFVRKMMTEIHYMTLVNNIIQLAHGLDLKVVAEGVETKEEAQLLKLLRCEQAQGYLYSKPVNAEAFAAMLR